MRNRYAYLIHPRVLRGDPDSTGAWPFLGLAVWFRIPLSRLMIVAIGTGMIALLSRI